MVVCMEEMGKKGKDRGREGEVEEERQGWKKRRRGGGRERGVEEEREG